LLVSREDCDCFDDCFINNIGDCFIDDSFIDDSFIDDSREDCDGFDDSREDCDGFDDCFDTIVSWAGCSASLFFARLSLSILRAGAGGLNSNMRCSSVTLLFEDLVEPVMSAERLPRLLVDLICQHQRRGATCGTRARRRSIRLRRRSTC
jgi:hypothetical protein